MTTVNEMILAAIDADEAGVPVDWKTVAIRIHNQASTWIADQEAEMAKLEEYIRVKGLRAFHADTDPVPAEPES